MTVPDKPSRSTWFEGPAARCVTVPKGAFLPWRIILLGAPGVGKGTQADLLNQHLLACHLSTGDVFRGGATRNDAELTPAMREALACMRRGELVPDTTVWDLVRERRECLRCAGGFILDGFPRTLPQAVSLKQFLDKHGLGLIAVVSYELPASEIVARLGGAEPVKSARRSSTSRIDPRRLKDAAIAALASCLNVKMTARNRLRSGWKPTIVAASP